MNQSFYIKAVYDAEAKVYYTESDIFGLHTEADSLEFEDYWVKAIDCAVFLLKENHQVTEDIVADFHNSHYCEIRILDRKRIPHCALLSRVEGVTPA